MATQNTKTSKTKNDKAAPAAQKPVIVAKAAPAAPVSIPVKPPVKARAPYQPSPEEIQTRAFEIYVSEGCKEGNDLENWLRAEKELRAQGSR
jgi:hypothetical protein